MEFKWVHRQLFVVEEVSVGFNWNASKLNFTLNLDYVSCNMALKFL